MSNTGASLTHAELEMMQAVWKSAPATVRDVYEILNQRRKVAYTTVLTMMKLLEQKGFLDRDRSERTHVYRPVHKRKRVLAKMVADFVERVLEGSAEPLVQHFAKERDLTPAELKKLSKILGKVR